MKLNSIDKKYYGRLNICRQNNRLNGNIFLFKDISVSMSLNVSFYTVSGAKIINFFKIYIKTQLKDRQ